MKLQYLRCRLRSNFIIFMLMHQLNDATFFIGCYIVSVSNLMAASLVPRPCPAFHHLQSTERWVGPGNVVTHVAFLCCHSNQVHGQR